MKVGPSNLFFKPTLPGNLYHRLHLENPTLPDIPTETHLLAPFTRSLSLAICGSNRVPPRGLAVLFLHLPLIAITHLASLSGCSFFLYLKSVLPEILVCSSKPRPSSLSCYFVTGRFSPDPLSLSPLASFISSFSWINSWDVDALKIYPMVSKLLEEIHLENFGDYQPIGKFIVVFSSSDIELALFHWT